MNRNKKHWINALIAILAALIAACTPAAYAGDASRDGNAQAPIELDGTSWILVQIHGQDTIADSEATLAFSDGKVHGNATCNGFSGPYERDGETLSFGLLVSTMMACPGMDQETAYLGALASTATYRIEGDRLVLSSPERDAALVFATRQHASLEGTIWQLTGLNTGTAIVSVLGDTEITATFLDGVVSGSAGCNSYFAAGSTDGSPLASGPAGSTRRFCGQPEGSMEQETAYLEALTAAYSLQIEGNVLTLSSADGARLLTFVAAEG